MFDRAGLAVGDGRGQESTSDASPVDVSPDTSVLLEGGETSPPVDGPSGPDGPDGALDLSSPDLTDVGVDLPWCGNGIVEGEEGCDDKNTKGGDGCSATCQPEPFHGDLVAYWSMNESSGSTATDSAGGHDGALVNMSSAAWVSGKMDNALELDGSDDYVDVGAIGTYDELTIALWVNVTSLPQTYNSIFHCDGWSSGDVHFMILGGGKVRFSLNGNSSVDRDSVYSFTNALKKWHHVAVVYKRYAKTVDFYIDGSLDVQRTYTTTRSAVLGSLQIGAWDSGARYFHGRIDDLRFYKVAVTPSHIQYLAGL